MPGTISKRTCECVDKQDQGNPAGVLLELTKWNAYLPSHPLWGCRCFWVCCLACWWGGEVSAGVHVGASFQGCVLVMWRAGQGAFVLGTLKAKGEVLCVTAGRLHRGARYISSFPYFSPIARSAPRVFHARPAFLPSLRVRESEGVVNLCALNKHFLVPLRPP